MLVNIRYDTIRREAVSNTISACHPYLPYTLTALSLTQTRLTRHNRPRSAPSPLPASPLPIDRHRRRPRSSAPPHRQRRRWAHHQPRPARRRSSRAPRYQPCHSGSCWVAGSIGGSHWAAGSGDGSSVAKGRRTAPAAPRAGLGAGHRAGRGGAPRAQGPHGRQPAVAIGDGCTARERAAAAACGEPTGARCSARRARRAARRRGTGRRFVVLLLYCDANCVALDFQSSTAFRRLWSGRRRRDRVTLP